MSDLQSQMNQSVQAFVVQVTEIARRAALDTLGAAFGTQARANGAPATKSVALGRAAAVTGSVPAARGSRGRGVKRAPEDIEAMGQQFVAFVKANPGLRIEQINKELGTNTKDLALPIRKALADGLVSAKGQKRATTYYPGKKAK